METNASIIICSYNEEKTIEDVVRKCVEYNPHHQVIVVDDGSEDQTPSILSKLEIDLGIKYIPLEENKGKSFAMVVGVEHADCEIILFFDADITGIQKHHFTQMLEPLTKDGGQADMVLGSPSETLIDYRVNPFKSLTGERALFKKDLLPLLENIRDIRFGVETYINLHYQANGKTIKYTLLDGLTHPTKYSKTSPAKATKEFISEGKEIAVTLLNNYDLITKRIGNSFEEQSEKIKDQFKHLQDDINDKINVLLKNNG